MRRSPSSTLSPVTRCWSLTTRSKLTTSTTIWAVFWRRPPPVKTTWLPSLSVPLITDTAGGRKSRPVSDLYTYKRRGRWLWINNALVRNKKFSGILSCQLSTLRRGCASCAIVPEPCSLSMTWELVSGKIKVKHAGANFAKSLLGNCFNDQLNKRLGMSGSWHALHGVEADLHCYSKVTICYLFV